MRALPHTYKDIPVADTTVLKFVVTGEAGDSWYEQVIKCAKNYKNEMMDELLDDVYDEYLYKRELFLETGITTSTSIFKHNKEANEQHRKTIAEWILKGRELNGEPRDFNF